MDQRTVKRGWGAGVVLAVALAVTGLANAGGFPEIGGFSIGCNYWASHAGMMMWRNWRPDVVERDLADLAANGIDTLRVFPLWPDFQPIVRVAEFANKPREVAWRNGPLPNPEGVDEEMMRRFRFLCDVAQRNGLRLVVGLVTGWMSGRSFVPDLLTDKDLLTDPEAVKWEVRFVRHFVGGMKDHPAIVAWDLGNECNCMQAPVTPDQAWNWMNAIGGAIRAADPSRPVVSGMHGVSTSRREVWSLADQGELMDVLTTHPYPLFTAECAREPFDTMRSELHPSAESLLYAGVSGKPCFVEEAGDLGRAIASQARSAAAVRAALFSSWADGLGAYLWWCAYDFDRHPFPPYEWSALERELGLFTSDRKVKPVLAEIKAFRGFLKGLPFRDLPPRRVDAVCIASEYEDAWKQSFGAFLLARQAGFDIRFAGAGEPVLPDVPLYILPSGPNGFPYGQSTCDRVFGKVFEGATVLMTRSAGGHVSGFLDKTGNEIETYHREPRTADFEIEGFGGRNALLHDSYTSRFTPVRSRVIGKTSSGEPVMTSCAYGKGKVVYVDFPVEVDSVCRAGCFSGEKVIPRYLVYRKAAEIAGIDRMVVKDDVPCVGLTEHRMPDGAVICIAINYDPQPVSCGFRVRGRVKGVLRGRVRNGSMEIPANDACVFQVEEKSAE